MATEGLTCCGLGVNPERDCGIFRCPFHDLVHPAVRSGACGVRIGFALSRQVERRTVVIMLFSEFLAQPGSECVFMFGSGPCGRSDPEQIAGSDGFEYAIDSFSERGFRISRKKIVETEADHHCIRIRALHNIFKSGGIAPFLYRGTVPYHRGHFEAIGFPVGRESFAEPPGHGVAHEQYFFHFFMLGERGFCNTQQCDEEDKFQYFVHTA